MKVRVRASFVKRRLLLHSASLPCGIASLSRELNRDVEYDLKALLVRLSILAKLLKDDSNRGKLVSKDRST